MGRLQTVPWGDATYTVNKAQKSIFPCSILFIAGHWIIAITSTPDKLEPALRAAREVVNDIAKGVQPISSREQEHAVKSLKSHLSTAQSTAPYWVEALCHLSHKGDDRTDINSLLDSLTLEDLSRVARAFKSGVNDVAEVLAYSIKPNKPLAAPTDLPPTMGCCAGNNDGDLFSMD